MFQVLVLLLSHSICSTLANLDYLPHPVKSCHIGEVVQNDCNKCLCTSRTVFECKPKDCNKTKSLAETDAGSKQICLPNQPYVQNLITCICTKDGLWPHKSCYETFHSLPPSSVEKHKCEPNTYVMIDCNVCRCGPDGEFIPTRCTKNNCVTNSRRTDLNSAMKKNSVYSNCDINNWYSLAPCQFCYCVNENKLVCNTGNYYNKKLELGTYDLQICGKELIREALELIPEDQRSSVAIEGDSNVGTETTTKNHKRHNKAEEKGKVDDDDSSDNTVKTVNSDKIEYYSDDSEEVKSTPKSETHTKITNTTSNPTNNALRSAGRVEQDDDETNSDDEGDSKDDSNEISIEEVPQSNMEIAPTPTKGRKRIEREETVTENRTSTEDLEYNGKTLKINLPNVLNRVFEMALRKSMVSLSAKTECSPGSTSMNGCNMCFCLKNAKMLCTANKC